MDSGSLMLLMRGERSRKRPKFYPPYQTTGIDCRLTLNLRFSRTVVQRFIDRYSDERSPPETGSSDQDHMTLEQKMELWHLSAGTDGTPDDLWDDEGEDNDEEINPHELSEYRNFMSSSPAYKWLLERLMMEVLLEPSEHSENSMEHIRQTISSFISSSYRVSKNRPSEAHEMIFEINWDPLAFITDQGYDEEPGVAIENAITLTGSTMDAQAMTCRQYLCQTWPSFGEHVIRLIKEAVRDNFGERNTRKFPFSVLYVANRGI
jgi:hypothetical protein